MNGKNIFEYFTIEYGIVMFCHVPFSVFMGMKCNLQLNCVRP